MYTIGEESKTSLRMFCLTDERKLVASTVPLKRRTLDPSPAAENQLIIL
jgi:hypothetical protein